MSCTEYNEGARTWCETTHGLADRTYRKWLKLPVFHCGFAGFHWPHKIRRPIIGWWSDRALYWKRFDNWSYI